MLMINNKYYNKYNKYKEEIQDLPKKNIFLGSKSNSIISLGSH